MAQGALGATFKVTRALQVACMIAIIGMTSNFVAQIVAANSTPSSVLIGTLSVVCIAVLYCAITFILFLDNLLPHLTIAIIDSIFLIALIVVSAVVGKPLSYLECNIVSKLSASNKLVDAFNEYRGDVPYGVWISLSKSTCLEMKSIWGLSIALCVLFTMSAATTLFLWKQSRAWRTQIKGEA